MKPAVLDLFCGAVGGWSLGLHRAGFVTVAACEIDEWRRAVFAHNFPMARLYGDVRSLDAGRLVSDLGRQPDLIVGSPPCQDASAANARGRGVDGARTGLFFEAIRLVRECRPRWAAFENSAFLRTRGYDRIAAALEALGYTCWPLVVGACDLRAPHIRKRVWIIAADAEGLSWRPGFSRATEREESRNRLVNAFVAAGVRSGGGWAWRHGSLRRAGASDTHDSGDADRARLEIWESLGDDACRQLAALERAIGPIVHIWNGGAAWHLGVAHGFAARLARLRVPLCGERERTVSAARACIAAQGDAILPQIAEAIGYAILRVEAALDCVCEGAA